MSDQPTINSLEDLRLERELLRTRIAHQEEVLKDHYNTFTKQLSPVFRIVNFLSGNRLFKGSTEDGEGAKAEFLPLLIKLILAGTAGGFMFRKTKKNLFKTALALALDQGIKFLREKDISSILDKIKEWWRKKKEGMEEDVKEEDVKEEDLKEEDSK